MITGSTTFFAVVPPDLVGPATEELQGLGVRGEPVEGGVLFRGSVADLRTVALHARLPTRLRLQLGMVPGTSLQGLAAGIRRLDWSPWIHPQQRVEVTVRAGKGLHRSAAQRKVEHALRDALRGPRRDPGRPPREPAEVILQQVGGKFRASIDATGEPLYRRGWKRDTAKAPLRESLAAAMLWLADWDPAEPLVDPMCGSGTLGIEAATIAAGLAPGRARAFAFESWPCHERGAWRAAVNQRVQAIARAPILASDHDMGAVRAARSNAERAGVAGRVDIACRSASEVRPPAPSGLVVCNPPYGKRVGRDTVSAAWRSLGSMLRGQFAGWRFVLLVPDPALLRPLGVRTDRVAVLPHGGIRVGVHVGQVE